MSTSAPLCSSPPLLLSCMSCYQDLQQNPGVQQEKRFHERLRNRGSPAQRVRNWLASACFYYSGPTHPPFTLLVLSSHAVRRTT